MSVITLAEAKAHVNITVGTYDGELQTMLDACEAAVAQKCGPLSSVARTERVNGGGTGLVVRETPMLTLTSVTPVNGTAYDVSLLTVDLSAGVIEWTSGACFAVGRYDVVYQAGRTLPGDLKLGVLELLRHKWSASQRGGSRRPGSMPSETLANTIPGAAFTFPIAVVELINPYVQVGN